jgi:hypothetical protein
MTKDGKQKNHSITEKAGKLDNEESRTVTMDKNMMMTE